MRLIEKKIVPTNRSFTCYRSKSPCLDEAWHYHQEFELTYVIEGKGLRFIGDDITEFHNEEITLVGSNLPHLWRNAKEYNTNEQLHSDIIVVQFHKDFLGNDFFNLHEMSQLNRLLKNAENGLDFKDPVLKEKIARKLISLVDQSGFSSIYTLLGILELLANSTEYNPIASTAFCVKAGSKNTETIDRIYQYVLQNFHKNISLSDVADIANMSESPFCRFFKKRTHKSFTQFLNEVRIGEACKLIIDGHMSIGQVAYACGFNSQTNFNRQFKKIKHRSPVEFKKYFTS